MSEAVEASLVAMEQETAGLLAGARQAISNFAGRIAGGLQSAYETFQVIPPRYRRLGIATIAAFNISHVETAVADPGSAAGDNVPGLMGAATLPGMEEATGQQVPWAVEVHTYEGPGSTGSSLTPEEEQQCEDDILARPTVTQQPGMYKAGIRGQQTTRAGFDFIAVHGYCAPAGDVRFTQIQEEIKKNGHWVTIGPKHSSSFGPDEQHSQYIYTPTHPTPAYVYSECIKGHFQPDRLVLTSSLKTGTKPPRKITASKQYILPTDIHGNCQAAVRSRRHYR